MKLVPASDDVAIFAELVKHSFCLIQLDDDEGSKIHGVLSQVPAILDSWTNQTYDEALEIGRQLEKNGKEFVAVKIGIPTTDLLPINVAKFCNKLFEDQKRVAGRLFCAVAGRHLEISKPELLLESLGPNDVSESFMHLFRYRKNGSVTIPCDAHTDSGLFTLIPRAAGDAGLLCRSKETGEFVNVEELFPNSKNVCAMLIGESLAALSKGKLVLALLGLLEYTDQRDSTAQFTRFASRIV